MQQPTNCKQATFYMSLFCWCSFYDLFTRIDSELVELWDKRFAKCLKCYRPNMYVMICWECLRAELNHTK